MTLGSLFDGIGGWLLAAVHANNKAIGNGMAQPVADWLLKRIVERSFNNGKSNNGS